MLGAALDCHLGEMPVYQTTNCRRHGAQLENSSPAVEGISLLGGLAWGSAQGPGALANGSSTDSAAHIGLRTLEGQTRE